MVSGIRAVVPGWDAVTIFCLATSLIVCAMIENALYIVLGMTMPKPEPPTFDDDDDDDDDNDVATPPKRDSSCVKRMWAIKGASAYHTRLFAASSFTPMPDNSLGSAKLCMISKQILALANSRDQQ